MAAAALIAESALTIASTGTAVALPSSEPEAVSASTEHDYGAAEAKDAASALLMARLQNRKIEVLSERTSDATTYALADSQTR
ncbi:hypothetical protein [Streptomyces aureus]|uniref:hypothetical protein n=1 Tax=Streptomyces aureus TaxID=193461 RepID=UPI003401F2A2